MSDPRIASDWTEETIQDELVESDVTLSVDDMLEILNGQADLHDRTRVETRDTYELYQRLVERYRQNDSQAYRRKMDIFNEDMARWIPPEMEEDKKPAQVTDFSHEVPTNYSRADDGLQKERTHYAVQHPETGNYIIHMFTDEYVRRTEIKGDDDIDE